MVGAAQARLDALAAGLRAFAEAGFERAAAAPTVGEVIAAVTGDICLVRLMRPDGADFEPVAAYHPDPRRAGDLGRALAAAAGPDWPWETVVAEQRAMRLAPARSQSGRRARPAVVIVPLVGPASILGAVALVRPRARRPFEADDELLLRGLADGAALALERARLAVRERAAVEQRRRGDLRLEAVLENAPDPVSRFDRQLRHTYLNLAAVRAAGLPTAGVLGRSPRELGLGAPSLEAWETAIQDVFASGWERTIDLARVGPTGPRRYQVRLLPEPGPDGRIESVLEVAREVPLSAAPDPDEPRQLRQRDDAQRSAFDRILAEEQRRLVTATQLLATLTPRERDVLRLLADGRSNKEVGRALGVSAGTAKNHVSNLLLKLGVEDRVQAAVRAVEAGIVRRPGAPPPAEADAPPPDLTG